MLMATTTGDFGRYVESDAEAVRAFEGTGFKHLDYSFYRLNYTGSEFMSDSWIKGVSAAAKEAEKLGFDFVQAHSPSNDYFNDDKETVIKGNIRSIEACAYLGINKLVVHSGRSNELHAPSDTETYIRNVREFYEALYPAMEKYNVYVLAENYIPSGNDICSFYSAEDLMKLMDCCNHPLLGVCWDIGHANLINPDQYGDIIRLGEKLKAVHIQDNFGFRDDHICPLMGTVDIDAVMRGLFDNGFAENGGVFTFEADNMVSHTGSWPNRRNETGETVAAEPTLEIRRKAEMLMYEIGKTILTKYNCFES